MYPRSSPILRATAKQLSLCAKGRTPDVDLSGHDASRERPAERAQTPIA
jgi:hypothetical protein